MLTKNIALIGFMGSGKSKVGKLIAECLGTDFADCDELIEQEAGMSITEIFAQHGEPHFRKTESEMIKRLCDTENLVLSTGGGVVINPDNVKTLKDNCTVVFLNVSPEEIAERLADDDTRPLLMGGDKLQKIKERLDVRLPLYLAAADIVVDCNGCTAEENCEKIVEKIKGI